MINDAVARKFYDNKSLNNLTQFAFIREKRLIDDKN